MQLHRVPFLSELAKDSIVSLHQAPEAGNGCSVSQEEGVWALWLMHCAVAVTSPRLALPRFASCKMRGLPWLILKEVCIEFTGGDIGRDHYIGFRRTVL